jgi:hypothetical protein
MSKKSKDTAYEDDPVYDPEPAPVPEAEAHEPSLEGKKLAAVAAEIRRLAAASGGDRHFTEAGYQQWASCILMAIEAIEHPAPAPAAEPTEPAAA